LHNFYKQVHGCDSWIWHASTASGSKGFLSFYARFACSTILCITDNTLGISSRKIQLACISLIFQIASHWFSRLYLTDFPDCISLIFQIASHWFFRLHLTDFPDCISLIFQIVSHWFSRLYLTDLPDCISLIFQIVSHWFSRLYLTDFPDASHWFSRCISLIFQIVSHWFSSAERNLLHLFWSEVSKSTDGSAMFYYWKANDVSVHFWMYNVSPKFSDSTNSFCNFVTHITCSNTCAPSLLIINKTIFFFFCKQGKASPRNLK